MRRLCVIRVVFNGENLCLCFKVGLQVLPSSILTESIGHFSGLECLYLMVHLFVYVSK